jgi:hypothetical protein
MIRISLTVVLAFSVAILIRSYRLSLTAALLCIALGFSLASTGLAPMIGQIIGHVASVLATVSV